MGAVRPTFYYVDPPLTIIRQSRNIEEGVPVICMLKQKYYRSGIVYYFNYKRLQQCEH